MVFPDYTMGRTYWWDCKRQTEDVWRPRAELPPDCPLLPKTGALLRVIWHVHREVRPRLLDLLRSEPSARRRLRFTDPRQTRCWLDRLPSDTQPPTYPHIGACCLPDAC